MRLPAIQLLTFVRHKGGLQGLLGDVAITPEEDYLACLLNTGLIPSNQEELLASGSFNIGSDMALVVPEPQDPGKMACGEKMMMLNSQRCPGLTGSISVNQLATPLQILAEQI